MLIYVDELITELDELEQYARLVEEKFAQSWPAPELHLDSRTIKRRVENLLAMLPEGVGSGNLRRHAHFLEYWLAAGNTSNCADDIRDIVASDIPTCRRSIQRWSEKLEYVDVELRKQVSPLIRTRQFDSAIRKAFVILKSRLCRKFSLDESQDGAKLINTIFAQNSPHIPELNDGEKQAYRDYFAGLFGLLRNKYAHNDKEPTFTEIDSVLSGINLCLQIIGDFKKDDDVDF